MINKEELRRLPKVDELLKRYDVTAWMESTVREVVVDALRGSGGDARFVARRVSFFGSGCRDCTGATKAGQAMAEPAEGDQCHGDLASYQSGCLLAAGCRSGDRSRKGYSTLEYDLATGQRGVGTTMEQLDRRDHRMKRLWW